ncbi:hypothetical protein HGRIS_003438 [Hohenbuehelia grisea]|uniref:Uncharacterized protein n=1 Tax=Hohenbuehelia grisea TaxID=104357 RepID=A0ABR3JG96_9AGAR
MHGLARADDLEYTVTLKAAVIAVFVASVTAMILLTLVLLPALFSRHVQRSITWINMIISWIVFSVGFLMTAIEYHGTGSSPVICVAQSMLAGSSPTLCATACLVFALELLMNMRNASPAHSLSKTVRILMGILPYTAFVGINVVLLLAGSQQGFSYCRRILPVESPLPQAYKWLLLFAGLLGFVVLVLAVVIAVELVRNWKTLKKTTLPLSTILRFISFCLFPGLSIALTPHPEVSSVPGEPMLAPDVGGKSVDSTAQTLVGIHNAANAAGLVLLFFALLPVCLTPSVRRSPAWINIIAAGICYGAGALLILGNQFESSPSFMLCLTQAMVLYSATAMLGVAFLCLVIEQIAGICCCLLNSSSLVSSRTPAACLHSIYCCRVCLLRRSCVGLCQSRTCREEQEPPSMPPHYPGSTARFDQYRWSMCCDGHSFSRLYRVFTIQKNAPKVDDWDCVAFGMGAMPIATALFFGTQRDIALAWVCCRRRSTSTPK